MYGTTFPPVQGMEQSQPQGGTTYPRNGGNSWQGNRQQNNGGGGFQNKAPWQGRKDWKRPEETDMSLYKPYAATGNREAPPHILQKFDELARMLETKGYTARVGGFEGIEETVEKATTKNEVHLPFKDFNQKQSRFTWNSERAFAIAKMFHPTFDALKKGVQTFLAKNARLIMGDKMVSPALFLLTWTEDGAESLREKSSRTGFTGHPIAIAAAIGIPIFNLGKPDAEQRLKLYLEAAHGEEL